MTDPTIARLDALGHESRACRNKVDKLVDDLHAVDKEVVTVLGVADLADARGRDHNKRLSALEARLGVLEQSRARSAGFKLALTIAAGSSAGAAGNWAAEHGGILEALSTLW